MKFKVKSLYVNLLLPKLQLNEDFVSFCTDSRTISENEIFIALKGESFDGHNYIDKVLSNNNIVIANNSFSQKQNVYSVEDTLAFIQELAIKTLKDWKSKGGLVIGLTGSNGKTTNKEILFELINNSFPNKVACTKGNFNNHIGVPLTIFEIKENQNIAIIEMGTNHPGEIERLCEIAQPDVGFITNIGDSHLEFLGSRQGVYNEKSSLYNYCLKNSQHEIKFFRNSFDEFLKKLEVTDAVVTFNEQSYINVENSNIKESYNIFNLSFCTFIATKLFPKKSEEILEFSAKLKLPQNNRSNWLTKNNKTIFLDAYNANPSSMEASLNSFINYLEANNISKDSALFIIGDMNELGEESDELHQKISKFLTSYKINNVAFIGRFRAAYLSGYHGDDLGCTTTDEFKEKWPSLFSKYNFFFMKASRSVKLEKLVESI